MSDQTLSERYVQRGHLRSRLTFLTSVVALIVLLALVVLVILHFYRLTESQASEMLGAHSHQLANSVQLWLDYNVKALQQLVTQPQIQSMDPAVQQPILAAMDAVYEHIYLVSTTDLNGLNVARSDSATPIDYHDRVWFQEIRDGAPLAYQVLVSRTTGRAALVISMPIRNLTGELIGVGMLGANLEQLSEAVAVTRFGETGVTYVVDAEGRIIAHPDPAFAVEIVNIQDSPVGQKLREGREQQFSFVDAEKRKWQAHIDVLDNGWGVVAQQEAAEWRRPLVEFARYGLLLLLLGSLLLGGLTYGIIRRALAPIETLTATATAIAQGDLTRTAPLKSADEIGTLAHAFNRMTAQLREAIDTLEQRVAARTFDLERHAAYLAASAEVSRAAVSILDADELIRQVVDLIRERFDLYYVGLFLVDETKTWAVLRSGTGAAGQAMLARQHRIRIGEGMVGWSIANAEVRVASHAEMDAVRLTNPELPDTRSEAALPLRSRGQVLGALTVQSTLPDAFDPDSMAVLQIMADQVAVALDNARLLAQAQAALEAERLAYGRASRQEWERLARARAESGYVGMRQAEEIALLTAQGEWTPEMRAALRTRQSVVGQQNGMPTLAVPIFVRDEVVGVLHFSKSEAAAGLVPGEWTREEITLLEALAGQLGQALDGARLYRQMLLRAAREGAIREISDRMQRATDMRALLHITAEALNQVLGGSRVYVRMGADITAAEQADGGDHDDAK